ncbi:TPA: hypothetical protein UMF63_000926 [Stenotrophomonas maltophilia]|uniref:hypothetical protein n=1 Tax=Stenotrophomonas maltophilia TaxID=40324 RepID=UPI000810923A|nr:hypothetical protein [Stenotrophomonas maltophilia]OCK49018.1 hypothetical protein BA766_03240 [Stenotrophomonas maltophilia]HEL3169830.1 hypothetical protein [Stenotrophomonas maltophilia]
MKAKTMRNLFLVCLLLPGAALALKGTKIINGGDALYRDLPNVKEVNVTEMSEIRQAGMYNMLGKYRLANGLGSIKAGETVTFMWPDGSIEKAVANDPRSSVGAVIIEGSQMTKKQVSIRCGSCHTQYR